MMEVSWSLVRLKRIVDMGESRISKALTKSGKPSKKEAIRAFCFDCCGCFYGGRFDCEMTNCPLYSVMPYRKLEPNFDWREIGSHLQVNRCAYHHGILPDKGKVKVKPLVVSSDGKKRAPFSEMIRAKCFECIGDTLDGRIDCKVTDCPFYAFMPYRELEPDYHWIDDGCHLSKNRIKFKEKVEKKMKEVFRKERIAREMRKGSKKRRVNRR